jgi:EH domain-containing protein 1
MHAYVIGHLKKEMPAMMGKVKAQQRLIENLEEEFSKVNDASQSLDLVV